MIGFEFRQVRGVLGKAEVPVNNAGAPDPFPRPLPLISPPAGLAGLNPYYAAA